MSDSDRRIDWLRQMLEIRYFEERVQELFLEGLIEGTTHLCQGQEGVSVGAIAALGKQDYLTITYRGHGHALARGMPLHVAFAELMGRETGCCGGVGGSMHLTDFSLGLIGSFAIVGAGLPVAVGAAMSSKLRGEGKVALSFCGDGATNIGTFHEALNMASVWKAPVVFVIENNLYAEYTPLSDTTAVKDIASRAAANGLPGEIVDGQDVMAVNKAVAKAIARARRGEGPTLLEAKTYRFRGHSRTDPAKYRPAGELELWKKRDPIDLLASVLVGEKVLEAGDQEVMSKEAEKKVDEASKQAASAAFPSLSQIEGYVYAN
jgi:TPP-dependent pyruvate/acetoin dehydrogenase alpha subunit